MTVNVGTAFVDVKPDLSGFTRDVKQQLDGHAGGVKRNFAAIGKAAALGLAAGAAGFAVLGKSAIDAASDINESLSKNDKLFGRYAKGVEQFAGRSAKSYGISKKAALEYTGVFGNLFRALGQSEEKSADQSVALTKLAADMASFNNTSVEDALDAIRSGLVGETEPLRRFGVNMNDATLRAQALKMGLIDSVKEGLTPQQKAMAATALITSQTSQAHGDFARTSDGLANQQKILKARLDDASAAIGARLLPFAVKAAGALNDMLTAAQNGTGVFGTLKGIWDGVAGAFSGGGAEGGKLKSVIDSIVSASQGLVDIGVALWERFGSVLTAQAKNLIESWAQVLSGVTTALGGLIDFIAGVFTGDWRRAWDGIKAIFKGTWDAILGILGYAWETIKNVTRLALLAIGSLVRGAWDALKGATSTAWAAIRDAILAPIRFARDQMEAIGAGIVNRLASAWSAARSAASSAWSAIRDTVLDAMRAARDAIPDIVTGLANRVASGWKNILGGARDFAGDVKGAIVGAFETAADKVLGFVRSIVGVINKLPGVEIKLATGGKVSAAGVDQALATGGQIRRGTRLTHPTVLMGEEAPRHPEFVIPTNPAYRKRALSLTAQLLEDLGVPLEAARGGILGYARGGIIGKASGILGDIGKAVGGAAKGVLDLPLKLIEKGASWIIDQLPNPADHLPKWLTGLGSFAISRVTAWVKEKVKGLLGSSDGGVAGGGGIVALGRRLQRMGYQVGEHPAFGGVAPVHTPGSYHYRGRAIDVNADGWPGGEPAALDRLAAMLRKLPGVVELLWRTKGHYDHLHVAMRQGGVIGGDGASIAPFVGSYANGGVVPRDGFAFVHQGETILPPQAAPSVRVFIGDRELTDIVRVEVDESDRRKGAAYRAGVI